MKGLTDNSDAPGAKHGTFPKSFTSSKRSTKLHSSHLQKSVSSPVLQQESQRREFVLDSGATVHTVGTEDISSAE